MKLLKVSQCHEDSPDFRSRLAQLEEATGLLEKKLRRICSICEERQALAERDRTLSQQLIREFEFFASKELDCQEETDAAMNSIEVMTTALKQLVDNQERLFEQINIGILKPLQHFIEHDVEQVKASRKTYEKSRSEATHAADKFCQCKKPEMGLLNDLSLQLFDSRYDLHHSACNYALDLNCLHTKKTPIFLQKLVDFMTSQLSYFHLGQIMLRDTEPHINGLYSVLERIRTKVTSRDTEERTQVKSLLEQVLTSRARDLVVFHTQDLHFPSEIAKSTISRHLAEAHPSIPVDEKELEPASREPVQALTMSGYLWYAEQKTFGTSWIRLYFSIRKGMLVSPESTSKAKIPISLSLNLCNVKQAPVADTERSFCLKVVSPVRTLLLQAESTQEMQTWIEVLNNAIAHALHGQSLTPEREMHLPLEAMAAKYSTPAPVVKPKKVNVSKDLYVVPGNDICADCGNAKPKWASVNLGVLICIECSGVHRSLGVYVSQVRSLTLDTLKPEWITKLKEQGNAHCNTIYEAHLPDDFDRDAIRQDESRQEFIVEKYIAMKYTSPEMKERILEERQQARAESLRKSQQFLTQESNESASSFTSASEETDSSKPGEGGEPGKEGNGSKPEKNGSGSKPEKNGSKVGKNGSASKPEKNGSKLGKKEGKKSASGKPDRPLRPPNLSARTGEEGGRERSHSAQGRGRSRVYKIMEESGVSIGKRSSSMGGKETAGKTATKEH